MASTFQVFLGGSGKHLAPVAAFRRERVGASEPPARESKGSSMILLLFAAALLALHAAPRSMDLPVRGHGGVRLQYIGAETFRSSSGPASDVSMFAGPVLKPGPGFKLVVLHLLVLAEDTSASVTLFGASVVDTSGASHLSNVPFLTGTGESDVALPFEVPERTTLAELRIGTTSFPLRQPSWTPLAAAAFSLLRPLAPRSVEDWSRNPGECFFNARRHMLGKGASQDFSKACTFYRRACDGGIPLACNDLGALTEAGKGVEQDRSAAMALYRRACEGGTALGCHNRDALVIHRQQGTLREQVQVRDRMRKRCEGGKPLACNDLGTMLAKGIGGAEDDAGAAALYRGACASGLLLGCKNLAHAFAAGAGVAADPARSVELYTKVCEAGLSSACTDLALKLESGAGVEKDEARALELLRLACGRGYRDACDLLKSRARRDGPD